MPSASVRRRNDKRLQTSRAAHLEGKLDNIVSLLQKRDAAPQDNLTFQDLDQPTNSVPIARLDATKEASPSLSYFSDGLLSNHVPNGTHPLPVSRGPLIGCALDLPEVTWMQNPAEPAALPPIPECSYKPAALEAEENLQVFRVHMLPFLPYVYLPPSTTAAILRREKPFLWFNIMTITCKNVHQQRIMSDASKKFLLEKRFTEDAKSLDLLLGLLTFLAWAQYHRKGMRHVSVMNSLLKNLVHDLGLNQMPEAFPAPPVFEFSGRDVPPPAGTTMEARRAALASFYVTSHISYSRKRTDNLPWTPYLEECLLTLSRHPECDGDELLVAQVKVQQIVDQLLRACEQSTANSPPVSLVSVLHRNLLNIGNELPSHLKTNGEHSLFFEAGLISLR